MKWILTLWMLLLVRTAAAQQRTLRWGNQTVSMFDAKFASAAAVAFACSDAQLLAHQAAATVPFVPGDGTIAQATLDLALCSYLRANATTTIRATAIANLRTTVAGFYGITVVQELGAFQQYCHAYDALKPDLDAATARSFAAFVPTLLANADAFLVGVKGQGCRDNFASGVAALWAVCAQAINSTALVRQAQTQYVARLLSADPSTTNLYADGTSFDFWGRDALFYHVGTLSNWVSLATRMPDGFLTRAQWGLIERGIYFLRQFYLPACLPACVYHREFIASQYAPDKTTLHGDLYGTIWPNVSFQANPFLYAARVPFVSVRAWTPALAPLSFAQGHTPDWSLGVIPYGQYNGALGFSAMYDAWAGVNASQVCAYAMRAVDSPNYTASIATTSASVRRSSSTTAAATTAAPTMITATSAMIPTVVSYPTTTTPLPSAAAVPRRHVWRVAEFMLLLSLALRWQQGGCCC